MKAVIALGSNLEEPEKNVELAITLISDSMELLARSSFYKTKPVGGPPQPDYVNAICIVDSILPPMELLNLLLGIEKSMGRIRTEKWGPRIIDCDLITYGDFVIESDPLTLPHPRAHERRFVLEPWYEIEPEAILPGHGRIKDILAQDQKGLEQC